MVLMKPGDTFMGLDLAAGGHLTHGAKPNMSGKWFNVVTYGVAKTIIGSTWRCSKSWRWSISPRCLPADGGRRCAGSENMSGKCNEDQTAARRHPKLQGRSLRGDDLLQNMQMR